MSVSSQTPEVRSAPWTAAHAASLLAHPLRAQIVSWPTGHQMSPRLVALGLDCKLSEAVYHLRVLCDGGALELVEESPADGPLFRSSEMGRRLAIAAEVFAIALAQSASIDSGRRAFDGELTGQAARDHVEHAAAAVAAIAETPPAAPAGAETAGPPPAEDAGPANPRPRGSSRRRSKRAEDLLQLVRRSPGVTVREAGRHFGLANATGLYAPVRRLLEDGLITKDGARLVPVVEAVKVRPGSWGERVLEQIAQTPGLTVGELKVAFGLEERSKLLYPPVRRLVERGVLAKDGSALYPVSIINGSAVATV